MDQPSSTAARTAGLTVSQLPTAAGSCPGSSAAAWACIMAEVSVPPPGMIGLRGPGRRRSGNSPAARQRPASVMAATIAIRRINGRPARHSAGARVTSYYRSSQAGVLELADGPDGQWSTPPTFPLGNGGLAGTADDWLAFGRMLLAGGTAADGRRLLTADGGGLVTSDHNTEGQPEIGGVLLQG